MTRAKLDRYVIFVVCAPLYCVAWVCIFAPYGVKR